MFERGQRIRIMKGDTPGVGHTWKGFEAEVVRDEGTTDKTLLRPLSRRPDGNELLDFFWRRENLELVEPLYTLAEAKAELLRQYCAENGHDDIDTVIMNGEPIALTCNSCGKGWVVEEVKDGENVSGVS